MAKPACELFGICGGCSLQNVDYKTQLENKRKILETTINSDNIKLFSDKEYNYRNRLDFIFHRNGVGFRKKNNPSEIIDVKTCPIADEKINKLLAEIRNHFKNIDNYDFKKKTGTYIFAVIRTPTHDSSISFVLNEDSTRIGDAVEKIKDFAKNTSADMVAITYTSSDEPDSISEEFFMVKGEDYLEEDYLGKGFHYSIQGFFQNNHAMAEKMQEYVHGLLTTYDTHGKTLLDLYAGVGTFGIINSGLFKNSLIVESFQGSIDSAKINIEKNQINNSKAICLDAKNLKKLDLPTKDLFVITDPPRIGMDVKTIDELKRIKPEVIIYISCNIEQLGKDLTKFKDYQVKSAALFDLFPQTRHCEVIVELVLKKA